MAAVNVDGMLLAPRTTQLPDAVAYAYVVHTDYPSGKPLVAKGFKHRAVEIAGKGGAPSKKATPSGPKYVDKEWLPAPLPFGWYINPATLRYEQRNADGVVITSSLPRPMPSAVSIVKKMSSVQRLRREYEVSILQPLGKGDSDSYLSYWEVRQRDIDFNDIFGIDSSHRWFAISKDVPEYAHEGESDGAFTAWELADAQKTELEAGAGSRKCLDRVGYWRLMGGGLLADESSVSAEGNHAPLSKWYQTTFRAQAQDSIEIFEWAGGLAFSIENGVGVFKATDNVADPSVLCLGIAARAAGSGSLKLDKEARVAGAPLLSWIRDVMVATTPSESFSTEVCDYPDGTPESLRHGLRLIAEQIQIVRPKKRKAVSATNTMIAEHAAMRRIITLKTFESAVGPLNDEDALMELAEPFVGHEAAAEMYTTAFAPDAGGSINNTTKKVFAKKIFQLFELDGEAQ